MQALHSVRYYINSASKEPPSSAHRIQPQMPSVQVDTAQPRRKALSFHPRGQSRSGEGKPAVPVGACSAVLW